MEQTVKDGDTAFLPEEIITNILKRLPVKSLIRFQCVCKYWKDLIKTPSFIADHLHHSSNHNPFLLFQRNHRNDPLHLSLLDRQMQVGEVPNASMIGSYSARIIGSSNGLLCVEIDEYGVSPPSLLLWNPATREVRPVPGTIDDFEGDCHLGFGFSPIVNDYKIVRTYAEYKDMIYLVEVYSVNTGLWEEIEFENLGCVRLLTEAVTANGVMFWCGLILGLEEDEDDIDVIVSFDIAMEAFDFAPIPSLGNDALYDIMVYENKLAIFSHFKNGNTESCMFDMWVMEEGVGSSGERWSWTKKYSSNCSTVGLLVPSTFWGNEFVYNVYEVPRPVGETKCEAENGLVTVLFLLNISTNEYKIFYASRCGSCNSGIFNYVESLVPVGNICTEEH